VPQGRRETREQGVGVVARSDGGHGQLASSRSSD
jgi:hypothetical protein